MENQHRKIAGYRELNEDEIALINQLKKTSITLGAMVAAMQADEALDQRWVSIGQTDLQKGMMALIRAVAQPETF